MKNSLVGGLLAAFLASSLLAPAPALGQVIFVSVGVQPKCPYGLSVCWPEAYEGLTMMDRVQSVDTQPSLETWTGTIRTKDGTVPDPAAWSREFKDIVGGTFGFRGVEVTVEGDLIEDEGQLALKVPGSGPLLRLAPRPEGPVGPGEEVRAGGDRRGEGRVSAAGGSRQGGVTRPVSPNPGYRPPRGLRQVGRRSCRSATSPGAETVSVRPRGLTSLPRGPRAI